MDAGGGVEPFTSEAATFGFCHLGEDRPSEKQVALLAFRSSGAAPEESNRATFEFGQG
jgi:hypothetical protein